MLRFIIQTHDQIFEKKDAAFDSIIYSLKFQVTKSGKWLWNQMVHQQFQVATGEWVTVNIFTASEPIIHYTALQLFGEYC